MPDETSIPFEHLPRTVHKMQSTYELAHQIDPDTNEAYEIAAWICRMHLPVVQWTDEQAQDFMDSMQRAAMEKLMFMGVI